MDFELTEQVICSMCTEYSTDNKCENYDRCKILGLLRERDSLKRENKSLKERVDKLETDASWAKDTTWCCVPTTIEEIETRYLGEWI